MHYILGCDIGTTSVKTIAFDTAGRILATASESYPMYHPQPGWSEQDPLEVFHATITSLKQVRDACRSWGKPSGIAFSAAMHGLMALNADREPISPVMIWADNRSGAIADHFRNTEEGRQQYQRTGTPVHAMTPASKFQWLREAQPDLFEKASCFMGIKEYVLYRLTGEIVTDYSMAAATGMLNLASLTWDLPTLQRLGLTPGCLPAIVPPYHQAPLEAPALLPEWTGIPVISGASDGCLANLGSGAIRKGTLALTIGTSGAIRRTSGTPYCDPQMRTFCYPLDAETFVIGGPTNNGGIVFQWLKDTFFPELTWEALSEAIAAVPAGADGLFFFPYLLGERAPLWDSSARGMFHGIDISHTRAHFARAVLEGILFNLAGIGEVLLQGQTVHTIFANGGFAQNPVWVQMLADILGIKVALNATNDTGCVGAALVGLRSVGILADFSAIDHFVRITREIHPDPEQHSLYRERLQHFISLQKQLPFQQTPM